MPITARRALPWLVAPLLALVVLSTSARTAGAAADAATPDPSASEVLGHLLDPAARQAIDDAAVAGARLDEGRKLGRGFGLFGHCVADVGSVEAGDDQAVARDSELIEHIGARVGIGGRGQR